MRRALAVTAVLACAPLSGCGHTVNVGPGRPVRVVLTEYSVRPDRVQVQAGPVTIVVRNLGRLNHNLAVLASPDQRIEGQTQPLAPGVRAELFLNLTPGTYVLDSSLFDDRALGLYGTLVVTR